MRILIFALPADAELQTVQSSVSPTPSATKTRVGNQSLAVQVCNSLVKLNERARSINRSFGEYFKLDGEMNEIYLKSQAHLMQATKEQFPKRKTNLGASNKTSFEHPAEYLGFMRRESMCGLLPEPLQNQCRKGVGPARGTGKASAHVHCPLPRDQFIL